MDTKDLVLILSALASIVFGAVAIITTTIREKHKAGLEMLKLDLKKLENFIETPGLKELVNWFDQKQPKDVELFLTQSVKDVQKLEGVVSQYGSLAKAIAAMKLDEPTFKIHQLIEANEKLYSRFQEHRASKAFLRR